MKHFSFLCFLLITVLVVSSLSAERRLDCTKDEETGMLTCDYKVDVQVDRLSENGQDFVQGCSSYYGELFDYQEITNKIESQL